MNSTYCEKNGLMTAQCPECQTFEYVPLVSMSAEQIKEAEYDGYVFYRTCDKCEPMPIKFVCPECHEEDEVDHSDLSVAEIAKAHRNDNEIIKTCGFCLDTAANAEIAYGYRRAECLCGGNACPSCSPRDYI